jgi:hypothetical protein
MEGTSQEPGFSGVLDRGLAIIEVLAGSADGMPLSAISDGLHIPGWLAHKVPAPGCDTTRTWAWWPNCPARLGATHGYRA